MLNTFGNTWVTAGIGIMDVPEHLIRRGNSWAIAVEGGSWWMWDDATYGRNHLESLREAVPFAVTVGSLDAETAREYITMYQKGRLTPTGVLGVFYRSGLKESYHVILEGEVVVFPYAAGRGFGKAATAAERMMSDRLKRFIRVIELESTFSMPV